MENVERFQIYVRQNVDDTPSTERVFYVFGERIETGITKQKRESVPLIATPGTPLISRRTSINQSTTSLEKAVLDTIETVELNDDDDSLKSIGKKFHPIDWSTDKTKVLLQAFAQKPIDFSVFLSQFEAMKYINANNVFVQKGQDAFHVSTPLFRVHATEIDLGGKLAFQITKIDKAYFQGKSGLIEAGLGEVAISDKANTDAHDFIFTADRIQDTIIPSIPVTVTQDAKINIALMICTFIFQVVQWALTRYLPPSETGS